MEVLVTGVAGFIGMHVAVRLLQAGHNVTGVDNLSDYYDVRLKEARLDELQRYSNFGFTKMDLANGEKVDELFESGKFERVIHLAAQAGVRYSLENPHAYIQSNIVGFANILEVAGASR